MAAFDFKLHQLAHDQPLLRFRQIGNERLDPRVGVLLERQFESIANCVELLKLSNRQAFPIQIEFDHGRFRRCETW